ncbi:hypothetical protein Vafri_21106, partial [Volvox africanus]
RWESRLLLNTLDKLYSSHVLGQVPFDLYDPVVTCPPPSKLMRLDPTGPTEHPSGWVDGAKWMCVPFPRTARPGCAVLSFGSNDQFEFERAALDMTPCTIHTFDCTTGMLGNATHFDSIDPTRHVFHPYCVGSREMADKNPSQVLTWEGIIQQVVLFQGGATVRQGGWSGGRTLRSSRYDSTTFGGGGVESASLQHHPHHRSRTTAADGVTGSTAANSKSSGARRLQRNGRARRREVGPEVFILKIDVESFEWQLVSEWGPNTPGLPAFLAIEIHNWVEEFTITPPAPPPRPRYSALTWWMYGKRITERDKANAAAAVIARRQRVYGGELSLMFLHLARLGYAIVSREDNPNGDFEGKLCCAEFLLIRLRGPEEGLPGVWDWSHWLDGFREGLRPLVSGRARRLLLG